MRLFLSYCKISAARLLPLSVLIGLGAGGVARADTFNVAAGDVNGLIAAINNANDKPHHPGANTIHLAGGVYTLTKSVTTLYGFTGLPIISSAITIEGNGAIIERSGAANTPNFRLFVVAGPSDIDTATNQPVTTGNLTLHNLWLRGGRAKGGDSGGGASNGDNNPAATGGGGMGAGGAIYNRGTLTISACTLSGNAARGGDGGASNSSSNGAAGGGGMGGNGGVGKEDVGGGGGGMGGNGGNSAPAYPQGGGGGGGTIGDGGDGGHGAAGPPR